MLLGSYLVLVNSCANLSAKSWLFSLETVDSTNEQMAAGWAKGEESWNSAVQKHQIKEERKKEMDICTTYYYRSYANNLI